MIAVEHYRDGQSNDSNPSFTLYLDWMLYIFLYFVISSPPLICGKMEVPNKTWKSAEHYHVLEIMPHATLICFQSTILMKFFYGLCFS